MMKDSSLETKLVHVFQQFRVNGRIETIRPYGSGHINDTFLVTLTSGEEQFILQKINHLIFKDVEGLMDNFYTVTAHIRNKSLLFQQSGRSYFPVHISGIECLDGNRFFQDQESGYWRVQTFVQDSRSYDLVTTEQQAYEGGRAFGLFQVMLMDLSPSLIVEILPDFHHIGKRLARLEEAIAEDTYLRATDVITEITTIRSKAERMCMILEKGRQGLLPLRILHNDTKFNNVLLDQSDQALCVIDLDTVMPGYLAYDFGDAIRTIINTAEEDEAQLERIELNVPLFQAYVAGYFKEMGAYISKEEVDSLIDGVLLLPYMQAVRFLTDYIEGDHYYKIKHKGHNLQRARAQLQLVKVLEKVEKQLQSSIDSAFDRFRK